MVTMTQVLDLAQDIAVGWDMTDEWNALTDKQKESHLFSRSAANVLALTGGDIDKARAHMEALMGVPDHV